MTIQTIPNYTLIREKLDQAAGILEEKQIDCWLTLSLIHI